MGDFVYRAASSLVASELVPAFARTRLMRGLGLDIAQDACIWAGGSFRSKRLKIGTGVFINVGFYHDGYDMLVIGDKVRIGPYVRILTATHEIGPPEQRGRQEVIGAPVTVGDGTWLGASVVILPGVTVAPGCVIAASSLLSRSTEQDGLYAGNPARRVRDLPQAA